MQPISKVSITECGIDILSGVFLIGYIHKRNVLPSAWKFLLTWLTIADILCEIITVCSIAEQNGAFNQFDNVTMNSICNDTVICIVLATVSSWMDASISLWTAAVGVFLFGVMWRDWNPNQCAFWMKFFLHACCWMLSLILSLVAFSLGMFGRDEKEKDRGWCDIRRCNLTPGERILWLFLTKELWEFLAYLTIANIILKISFRFCSLHFLGGTAQRKRDDQTRGSINSDEGIVDIAENAFDRNVRLKVAFNSSKMFFWLPLVFLIIRISGSIRLFIKLQYYDGKNWSNCDAEVANDVLLDIERIIGPTLSIWNLSLLLLFHRNAMAERTVVPTGNDG